MNLLHVCVWWSKLCVVHIKYSKNILYCFFFCVAAVSKNKVWLFILLLIRLPESVYQLPEWVAARRDIFFGCGELYQSGMVSQLKIINFNRDIRQQKKRRSALKKKSTQRIPRIYTKAAESSRERRRRSGRAGRGTEQHPLHSMKCRYCRLQFKDFSIIVNDFAFDCVKVSAHWISSWLWNGYKLKNI